MKKLFTEYWQEFDVQYIKNMYGAELPLHWLEDTTNVSDFFVSFTTDNVPSVERDKPSPLFTPPIVVDVATGISVRYFEHFLFICDHSVARPVSER